MLIANWKQVLVKSATVWVAVIGAIIPELPDLLIRWLSDPSSEVLSPNAKNWLRMVIMIVLVPIARVWQQRNLRPDNAPPPQPLKGDPS